MLRSLWRHRREVLLGGLFALTAALWSAVLRLPAPGVLEVTFFDVGQGDAIFIEAPNGNQILIDGGPDRTILEKLGSELGFFDRSVDLVVSTHPDRDHIAGLLDVLDRYDVGSVLTAGVKRATTDFVMWEQKLKEKHTPVIVARTGMWAEVAPAVGLVILSPDQGLADRTGEKTNNSGIVLKLMYGGASYLFTADIERPIEELLVHKGLNLASGVLKAAHHGSKTSSSENFMRAVSPAAVVISAGRRNPYGHPHALVLERLRAHGARVFRTDLEGDVTLVSDGGQASLR